MYAVDFPMRHVSITDVRRCFARSDRPFVIPVFMFPEALDAAFYICDMPHRYVADYGCQVDAMQHCTVYVNDDFSRV
jgi:hypothetical protein